jgi:Site-specific recombinase XerD
MAGLYRRGAVYWARAQRGGREYRRSLKTRSRSVAERRAREWLDELDAVAWGDKPRRFFDEAVKKFTLEHIPTIKPNSAKRYGVSMGHLSLHFAGKMLHQITSAELSAFETKRRTTGAKAGTIRRDFACLSSILTSCVEWEWAEENPVPSYMRRRAKRGLKEAPGRTRYLSEGEEAALLSKATPANARTKTGRQAGKWTSCREAITLAIDTGLRREELFSLKWDQVDMDRGLITTTTNTKSGRLRVVPLPERSRTILGTLPRWVSSPYVLVNPETETRYGQMNIGLKNAARRAGIKDLRWHDLRRTAGCRWLQRDSKTMAEVSIMLGHSSIAVTEQRYAFLEAEAVAQSISGRTNPGTQTADSVAKPKRKQRAA